MKEKLISMMICLVASTTLFAQNSTNYLKSQQLKANLNAIGASLSYETKLSNTNTLYFEGGGEFGISYSYSSAFGSDYRYAFSPFISAEGRHYYHFKERLAKGKSIANNGSNFWFLHTGYIFKPISHTAGYEYSDAISFMPGWGIQRAVGRHFSLELGLGLPVSYHPLDQSWYVGPGGSFKFGYMIK